MPQQSITFRIISPRLWNGNGFGYTAATRAVVRDGRNIGYIVPGWYNLYREQVSKFRYADLVKSHLSFADARQAAQSL